MDHRSLTTRIGEVQQRLPPKRRKPSLPQVSLERIDGKGAAARAKARLLEHANPKPVSIPQRHDIIEERVEHVSAGVDRSRAPRQRARTLVERMYDTYNIDHGELDAAGEVRNLCLIVRGASEGVSSYGDPRGSGPPWNKADRKAVAVMRNRSDLSRLAQLMYAMCGVEDDEGRKGFDDELFVLMVRACIWTVDAPTLGEIGALRSQYQGEKHRQAAGCTVIRETLRRGAAHLRLVRLPEWREASLGGLIDPGK